MLAFDTEATGLNQWAPEFSVFMAQWANTYSEDLCDENTGWDAFLAAIAGDDMLVAANASYDIHALFAAGIVDLLSGKWRVHDVTTLARVCIPGRFGYKLEALGTDILGADATEGQRELREAAKRHGVSWTQKDKDYYGLWLLEPELMEKYGREDVRLAFDLFQHIWQRASPADREVYRMEIAEVAPLLREAERRGVLVDVARLGELEDRLLRERDELRVKLIAGGMRESSLGEEVFDDEDPDAPADYGKATSAHLLEDLLALGVPLYRFTPSSGKPKMFKGEVKRDPDTGEQLLNPERLAVNADALREFELTFPVVRDLLDWRNRCKILKTYVGALRGADATGRVHTSFNQVAARTSRMSSSRPAMQNLPTPESEKGRLGVRDVLIPAPGNSFICADYDSIEVRVLAHYVCDPELTALLDAGMDLHQRTAWKVAMARGEKCEFNDFVKGGPRDKDRTIAKVTTFTSMYGGGARLLAVRLGVSVAEAARIKQETLDCIPGYWEFDERVKAAVRRRAFPHVTTITGRRLHVPRDKPYVALNTLIQGTSAEIMKLGLVKAAPAMAEFGYGVVLVVHDELLSEGPTACVQEAQAAIVSAMESAYPLSPRLLVSANNSAVSYGDAK